MKPKPNSAMNLIKRATQLLTVLLVFSIMFSVGYGQVLAQAGVCDPLKAEGVTIGLYGLCVSFCEAQDFASVELPLTDEQKLAMENGRPEGRILENYYKIKKVDDPEMPCAVPAEGKCPCFSDDEFRAMSDGVRDVEPYDEIAQSWEAKEGTGRRWMLAYGGEEGVRGLSWTWVESNEAEGQWCFYEWVHEGYPVERRTILDITDEQFMACYKAIEAECPAQ